MSHSCAQHVCIVSESKNDAEDLIRLMADNVKGSTGVDALCGVRPSVGWKALVEAVAIATQAHGVAFFGDDPDAVRLAGSLESWEAFGRPCICVELDVRWGGGRASCRECSAPTSMATGTDGPP